MKIRDIRDFNRFLDYLRAKNVHFALSKVRDEAVLATVHTLGHRIEIEFFDDRIEYSVFSGDESVRTDTNWIFAEIRSFIEG